MTPKPRFKIIRHRNGTATLIDWQEGKKYLCVNEDCAYRNCTKLQKWYPLDRLNFYNNICVCFDR